MTATLSDDALDPVVRKIGEVAGILNTGGAASIRDEFLAHPLEELGRALRDRQREVIELLSTLLGDSDAEVLGVPAGGTDDHWIPIRDQNGRPTGLYLVLTRRAPHLHFALGWKWEVTDAAVTVRAWAQVPLLRTDGTGSGTEPRFGTADAPVRLAAEVTLAGGFGVEGLHFRGVRGVISVSGTSTPDVALVLLGLQLGEAPAADRSLADLAALPADTWIETAVALFTAQLSAAGASTEAGIVREFVLPLLGVTAPAPLPRLRWEELPARGSAVFDEWFTALTASAAVMRAWLEKWQGLLNRGAGSPTTVAFAGAGTRADPWRAGVTLSGGVVLSITAALEQRSNGVRVLYPGVRIDAPSFAIGGSTLRLELRASAEIVGIPVGGAGTVAPLPNVAVLLRLVSTTETLVTHTFPAGDALEAIGTLSVGSLETGLVLDAQQRPVPHLALRNVQCARGSWPLLDLTSADAILDGLGTVASNLIQQQLEQGLALANGGAHAGRRVAALLGMVAPTAGDAPSAWPLQLVTHPARITRFLGDPSGEVARYYATCLTTDIDGAAAWRFLLAELGELLRGEAGHATPLRGGGTRADPWRVRLGRADAGDLSLHAHFALDGGRPQLRAGIVLDPPPAAVDGAALTLGVTAELVHLDLPAPTGSDAVHATWLPALRAELRLAAFTGLVTPPLGALRVGAASLTVALEWSPTAGAQWAIDLTEPWAAWEGLHASTLQLPTLRLDRSGAAAWTLTSVDLGGSLGTVQRDAIAELCRFVTGHIALEHGGPVGFAAAALFGLLPADPQLSLPAWREGDPGFALPPDFPVFQPTDWGAFFADPWPDVRAHLLRVLAEPRYTLPVMRWLAAAARGLAPRRAAGAERFTYPEARGGEGYFVRPDGTLADPRAEDDVPLGFPDLASLFELRGDGTIESPYAVRLRAEDARAVEALLWLDPEGPPAGSAVDAALGALTPALRDVSRLGSIALDQLVTVLSVLARIDGALARALDGVTSDALVTALGALEEHLRTSDGVVLTASQQPTDASWTTPGPVEAAHTAQLSNTAIVDAIRNQITAWDASNALPVLLLCAPFARNGAWDSVTSALGAAATPFTYRVAGVAPSAVSLLTLSGTPRIVAAELAVYNDAPGVAATDRFVPVDAPADAVSQAEQVARLIERLRTLHGGKRVIVVAHSASGLAARAAVQRAAVAVQVRGVITVGTPHVGTPTVWAGNPTIAAGVSALQRAAAALEPGESYRAALDALWQFIRARDLAGEPLPWPAHAFTPSGLQALPAGVNGLALASRLPGARLREQIATAIATRAAQLRTALAGRAPVTHVGLGLRLAPRVSTADPMLDVACSARVDVTQFRVAAGGTPRTLPRLVLTATLRRRDGWLVGGPDATVRVRAAELGCTIGADGIVPNVHLHDAAVDGVERLVATLHRVSDDTLQPDEIVTPALDAVLARLTAGATVNSDVMALAGLLASLDLLRLRETTESGGYAINPDGWSGILADGRGYTERILAQVLADGDRRAAFITRVRAAFGFSATDLSRLLGDDASDPPAWRALRTLLRAFGLIHDESRGATPKLERWLELVQSPAQYMRTHVLPLLRDNARRAALLHELRVIRDVRDVGQPSVTVPLGSGVQLHVEALGRVTLSNAEPVTLGGACALRGALELDLAAGTGSVTARMQPAGIATGVRWHMSLPASGEATWDLALDFGDGVTRPPHDALPLYPVPTDMAQRLGTLLPRITIDALATALLDGLVLPRVPELARVLTQLGLAYEVEGGRARLRNLSRVVADPRAWLLSPRALGTTEGRLDATRVAALVGETAIAFRIADETGTIVLPNGIRVHTLIAPTARIAIETDSALALGTGVTLDAELGLGWTAAGQPGADAAIDFRAQLPGSGPWPVLRVQAGFSDGAFRLALGADDALIQLLPFAGFDARALATAAVNRLLPTMIDALMQALAQSPDPAVVALIGRIRTAAAALELDSIAHLDAVVSDPAAWVRRRFSAANANASATALHDVLQGVPNISVDGGNLRFQPAGTPVAVTLGRNGTIGAGLELTNLDLGPATLGAAFRVGITDSATVAPAIESELHIAIDDGVIAPAGVSVRPSLHLRTGTSGVAVYLYPIGDEAGSPDFRLDVLPSFTFGVEGGGTVEDALLELARRVLVPVVIETFLDSNDVTTWLNTPIHGSLRPGPVLGDAGLIVANGAGWDLRPLTAFTEPIALVEGLIGAALRATASAFGTSPVMSFGAADTGLYVDSESAGGAANRYGVRIVLPELRVSEDPEIVVILGGRSDWISAAGHSTMVNPGIRLLAVRDNGPDTNPRFAFDPVIELAGVGLHVSGRADEPLMDLGGFRLGGLEALLFLRVDSLLATPSVKFGLYGDIQDVAVPLGAANSNPVAASLMSGSNGDDAPVNPQFSVRAAYVENLWLEIGGEERNEVWFPIQKTFGPVSVQQVGVRWIGGADVKLAVLLDGGVALAGLAVGVDDLSLTMPLARITDIEDWELGLRGLAVSYSGGGVKIGGGLLQASDEIRYDGFLLVEVSGRSFVAFGSYGVVDGETSLFVFLVVGMPIGGPPYFFIIGLAGGFGYNRGLSVPAIEGVPAFPLVSAMSDPGAVTASPMDFLRGLGPSFPMERGSYWFAAGLKFTSFTLVNSQALLYVLLNRGLEIGILGMSQCELPPAAPLASVELALKARFSTIEGVVSVEARLTDNSWLLSRDCRLTGGFAFFLWFGGANAGDFVITIGGYHPRYTRPAHYPDVPRLGFNWRVGSAITIKGEAYFALTPREVMAGGLLEASYQSGKVRAWFRAWMNAYIQWRPFWFEVDIGISIGVSVKTWLGTVRAEVGAALWIWGPDIGGTATIELWVITFTIGFGAARVKPAEKLSWPQFRTTLLPPEDDKLYSGMVERGLITGSPATGPWALLPEFVLRTEVFIGTSDVVFGRVDAPVSATVPGRTGIEIDVRPMQVANVLSRHTVRVVRRPGGTDVTARLHAREVIGGNVPRALWDLDESNPARSIMPAHVGTRLVAEFDHAQLDSTGRIPWTTLFEEGTRHPLPFAVELDERSTVAVPAGIARELDRFAIHASAALHAAGTVLHGATWSERRATTLAALEAEGVRISGNERAGDVTPRGAFRSTRRSSPPVVRSLYEGLASDAVPTVETTEEITRPLEQPVSAPVRPVLEAVIRQRAEPTRAGARAVRTTVEGRNLQVQHHVADMRALLEAPIPGATVLTAAAATVPRESAVAAAMPVVKRGLGSTAEDLALLDALESAAFEKGGGKPPKDKLKVKAVAPAATTMRSATKRGAPVDAGSTLRWSLPSRSSNGGPPVLHMDDGAAARVTALDRAGAVLLDVETVGAANVALPPGVASVTVTGLGSALREMVRPALGAVTLHEATSPVPVVGWQSHTPLIAASPTTLLARGASIRLASPLASHLNTGIVTAAVALAEQRGVMTMLPVDVRAVAIVLDEEDGSRAGDAADSLAVGAAGGALAADPVVISAGARTLLLYDVLAVDNGAPSIALSVAVTDAWSLAGVMGFAGKAEEWAVLLATNDLDTLVENGPLSPTGASLLRFSLDQD